VLVIFSNLVPERLYIVAALDLELFTSYWVIGEVIGTYSGLIKNFQFYLF